MTRRTSTATRRAYWDYSSARFGAPDAPDDDPLCVDCGNDADRDRSVWSYDDDAPLCRECSEKRDEREDEEVTP